MTYHLSQLKRVREWRGLTQQQLAEQSGVAISAIQKHERGAWQDTALSVAAKLSETLNVPIEALYDAAITSKWVEVSKDGVPA